MCLGKKARPFRGLRFIVLFIAVFFSRPSTGQAECPPGSDFRARNQYHRSVSVARPDLAVNECDYSVSMDLTLPAGDADIHISGGHFNPTVTIPLDRWQWRLRVPRPTSITAGDLIVGYQVVGSDGTPGVFTSELDAASHVAVTVSTREIRQRQGRKRRRFLGYIDLLLDYTHATRSGRYTGTITVFVDCR